MEENFLTISDLLDKYRFSVMCELDDCQELEESIKAMALASAEEKIRQIRESVEVNRAFLRQAYSMGRHGISKASVDFQSFLEKVKSIQDTVLVQAVLSCHDKGMAEFQANEPEENSGEQMDTTSTEELANALRDVFANAPLADNSQEDEKAEEIATLKEEILQYRTWINDQAKARKLKEAVERISALDAKQGKEAQHLLNAGRTLAELNDKAYHAGFRKDEAELKALKRQARSFGATQDEIGRLLSRFKKAKRKADTIAADKKAAAKQTEKIEIPEYGTEQNHPFFLSNVAAAKHWNIFIDETGQLFNQAVYNQGIKEAEKGKFVALFVPEGSELPALGAHHATDAGTLTNQKVLETLFNKGDGCAILGVTLDAMPNAPLDYWYAGLERLFDLSLRFLPESNEHTVLEFFVENRGGDSPEDIEKSKAVIQRTAEVSLYKYTKNYPLQAKNIEIKIQPSHNFMKRSISGRS